MKIPNIYILFYLITFISAEANRRIIVDYELPFVVSICSYNNAPWITKNLDSIFMQRYSNFHVIYIDDASSDGTAKLVQEYIDTHQLHDKITLLVNSTRQLKMKNIYNVFHSLPDDKIIIQVDGDDWLAHDQVFSQLNKVYQTKDIWLTYGQFIGHDGNEKDMCQPVPKDVIANRSFRSWQWVYTHLRTFYAWLFKNIKLEDFINERVPGFEGKFFPQGNDAASYFPMLEMCGPRFSFIKDILYIYNRENPYLTVNHTSHLIMPASRDIRSRPKYPQVHAPIIDRLAQYKDAQADLIILSNNIKDVRVLLKSLPQHVTGIDTVSILHEKQDSITHNLYKQLETIYPQVQCFSTAHAPINECIHDILQKSMHKHIIIATDTHYAIESIDIPECIIELEKTGAYGFYFGFAHTSPFYSAIIKKLIPHEHIYQDLYAWKFECEKKKNQSNRHKDPYKHNNLDMTLLRKQSILERINKLSASNNPKKHNGQKQTPTILSNFIHQWQKYEYQNMHNIGLFFKSPKLEMIAHKCTAQNETAA